MKIPVLVYHDVVFPDVLSRMSMRERVYAVTRDRFNQHLRFLCDEAFQTVGLGTSKSVQNNSVILTFDDGFESAYACHLNLMNFGFHAVFFITTDFVGRESYLSWEEIREMDNNGMSIQSHTCSHPILSELGRERVRMEFSLSKDTLE